MYFDELADLMAMNLRVCERGWVVVQGCLECPRAPLTKIVFDDGFWDKL